MDGRPLGPEDRFRFECRPECMGQCCAKLDLRLDPWDLEVLARGLGMNTSDLVDAYGELQIDPVSQWPYARLHHAAGGRCPFLDGPEGRCSVYHLRPRDCRAYPVTRRITVAKGEGGEPRLEASFALLPATEGCLGPEGPRLWTVQEWLEHSDALESFRLSADHLALKALAAELKYHLWQAGNPPHMLLMLFLFEPDLIREEFGITEAEVGHADLYRRRMQALRLLLTDQAARNGCYLETGDGDGDAGEACALDLSGEAPDMLAWMLSILRGQTP